MSRKVIDDQANVIIPWTNSTGADIAVDTLFVTKHGVALALVNIPDDAEGSILIGGKVKGVPKVNGAVFVAGEKLVYDVSAGKFDDSAAAPAVGDLTGAAVAIADGANGEDTCDVLITPGNATLTAA